MSEHSFQLRASFGYRGDDNQISAIDSELLTSDGWCKFELANTTPGFLIFVYSLLICQHTYFHGNCTEQGLLLDHADAELSLLAADNWKIERIEVSIKASLRGGIAEQPAIDYIKQRMRLCPVSINLKEPQDYRIELDFG